MEKIATLSFMDMITFLPAPETTQKNICRRFGQSLYYKSSKEFLEAGRKRLAGDTAREATSNEVQELRAEAWNLK